MYIWYVCVSVPVSAMPKEARGEGWSWGYRHASCLTWVVGIQLRSSGRTRSPLYWQAISPALTL